MSYIDLIHDLKRQFTCATGKDPTELHFSHSIASALVEDFIQNYKIPPGATSLSTVLGLKCFDHFDSPQETVWVK